MYRWIRSIAMEDISLWRVVSKATYTQSVLEQKIRLFSNRVYPELPANQSHLRVDRSPIIFCDAWGVGGYVYIGTSFPTTIWHWKSGLFVVTMLAVPAPGPMSSLLLRTLYNQHIRERVTVVHNQPLALTLQNRE